MQVNRYWLFILALFGVFLLIDYFDILNRLIPDGEKKAKKLNPMLHQDKRLNLLSDALGHDISYLYDIQRHYSC